jgi:hypothetical protein
MQAMDRLNHWNGVYRTKSERDVSWFEPVPALSLRMIEAAGLDADTSVLDVGGGDSHLVDELLARGTSRVTRIADRLRRRGRSATWRRKRRRSGEPICRRGRRT